MVLLSCQFPRSRGVRFFLITCAIHVVHTQQDLERTWWQELNSWELSLCSDDVLTWQGTTTRSIKQALGPQFGTLAFAGAILTLVDLARSITDQVDPASSVEIIGLCRSIAV